MIHCLPVSVTHLWIYKLDLNAICLLHVYAGLPNLLDNHAAIMVLKNVKRIKKEHPHLMSIITIGILKETWELLAMNQSLYDTF